MGHPLWDQDSAVGSQYRNLVNHNILHRKQGEWGREGDRETETDREGGRDGETEVKQAYKLSKCLLHLPSPHAPPLPAVMYFLQQASVSESLVTSPGIPSGGDQVLSLPLGGHFLFKPPQWERKQNQEQTVQWNFSKIMEKISVSVLPTKWKYALDLKKKKKLLTCTIKI